ncbi:MAG: c-type cytochrome, partial [Steroidobacteraceae bacterium]
MLAERPDEVVFNGVAFQYREHPLVATAGKRIRIYFVDAGPNLWTSFHVIGSIFDKVYPGGDAADALSNVSTYTVGPGAGAIFDLVIPKPGKYAFVDHDMAHLMIGAVGILDVRASGASTAEAAVATAPVVATSAVSAPPLSAPSGPYHFDPDKGAALFSTNCAACHQATGEGISGAFPPLKGNAVVLDSDPTKQIEVVLHGLHGESVGGTVYPSAMPPFGSSLDDADIANVVDHERSSWSNHAKLVTADQVKAVRAKGPAK